MEDLISMIQPYTFVKDWQKNQMIAFIEEFCTVPIEE